MNNFGNYNSKLIREDEHGYAEFIVIPNSNQILPIGVLILRPSELKTTANNFSMPNLLPHRIFSPFPNSSPSAAVYPIPPPVFISSKKANTVMNTIPHQHNVVPTLPQLLPRKNVNGGTKSASTSNLAPVQSKDLSLSNGKVVSTASVNTGIRGGYISINPTINAPMLKKKGKKENK